MKKNYIKKVMEAIKEVKRLKIGLILLFIVIAVAVLSPVLATHDPFKLNDEILATPSNKYLLGTDGLGRDLFSGILYGTHTSLSVGIMAATISAVIGILIGGIAGFYGGKVDHVISEIINIFLMMPSFFLILIIVALFGSSLYNMMLVIGITTWTSNAKLMRAQTLSLKERTFVKSLITLGESNGSILLKHIIPNGIFPIIANTTMNISGAILTEASLSFLGLGDPNLISWGQMVFHGRNYLTNGWWVSTFPGIAILITVLAFYLIGDGLNTLFNPKLRKTAGRI